MRCLFIVGIIIFANCVCAMNSSDRDDLFLSNSDANTPSALRLLDINAIQIENDEDFSDTSSSTVEADKLLPLSNLNIRGMIKQEISPDIYGITSVKIDFAKLDRSFVGNQDAKNWKPPLIPFGGGSEVSENQSENVDDGSWLNFLF